MPHRLFGTLYFGLFGLVIGYVLATAWLDAILFSRVDFWYIVSNLHRIATDSEPRVFVSLYILAGCGMAGVILGLNIVTEKLTEYGTSAFQTLTQMKKNKWFEYDHLGFLLARTHAETSRLPAFMHDAAKVRYIAMASDLQPHVMVIAPTGSGKGVGFVIPNLLQSSCSSVVLDVKGENYEKTSRLRHDAGYKIIRFAPTDYGVESSSYNPLVRISKIEDRGEQMLEVEMLATLFLKTSNDKNESLLSGGRQVFVACTMLAFEQGQPNLGHVYDLVNSGGTDLVDRYKGYADTTDNPRLRIEFEAIAANDPESLANMVSIMNNAGLAPWKHERVRSLTKTTDFEFSDLRSKRPVRPRSVSFQPSSPTASPDPAA